MTEDLDAKPNDQDLMTEDLYAKTNDQDLMKESDTKPNERNRHQDLNPTPSHPYRYFKLDKISRLKRESITTLFTFTLTLALTFIFPYGFASAHRFG